LGASARIDELRKRYDENPRRFFAPLANEYRKGGDLEQAIDLCRAHLADAPSNLSGQIVYGQALFESGSLDDARAAFELAVELDPENLIALRHLGDIGRVAGDSDTAIRWYQRVLDADPRNDEIAELIKTARETLVEVPAVEAESPAAPETPLAFEPTSLGEPETSASEPEPVVELLSLDDPLDDGVEMAPLTYEPVSFEEPEAPLVPLAFGDTDETPVHVIDPSAAADDEPFLDASFDDVGFGTTEPAVAAEAVADVDFGMVDLASVEESVPAEPAEWTSWGAVPPADADAEPSAALADAFADDLSITEATTLVFEAPVIPTAPAVDEPSDDLISMDSLRFDAEPPADATPLPAVGAPLDFPIEPVEEFATVWEQIDDIETAEAAAEATLLDEAQVVAAEHEAADEEPAFVDETPAAPFATETMAELYLRQGLRSEAIAVYRQLIEQRPDDLTLHAALASIEMETPAPAAAEHGPNARAFFNALSTRRAVPTRTLSEASTATVIMQAPVVDTITSAAPTPVSTVPGGALDALFGNGAVSGADEQAANALAAAFGAAEAAPAGRPTQAATGELSLDQVFRQSAPTPARPTLAVPRQSASIRFDQFFASPDAPPSADGEAPPPPAPGSTDAQFQDWLSGLKRT
jgi:tetratricopeptide (TPR) repeat protein